MNADDVTPVGNELSQRAPADLVLQNWRLWYFGLILVLLSIVAVAGGVYLSLRYADWAFLARFGAFEVILGSYLIGRPIWRRRFKPRFSFATMTTGGQFSAAQLAEYIMERTDIWFFYVGFVIAAVGSLVWGFADLLNCAMPGQGFPCTVPIFGSR